MEAARCSLHHCFFCGFAGSQLLTVVSNRFMKPVLLLVLLAVAVYTFSNKNFGQQVREELPFRKEILYGFIIIGVTQTVG